MEISVIIPVYNSGKFIYKNLEKLIQSGTEWLDEIELIIVNDGSQDDTLKEIMTVKLDNPNVNLKIINQKNEGVSSARNTGLNISCGKYILFIDSDDYISSNLFKEFFNVLDSNYSLLYAPIITNNKVKLDIHSSKKIYDMENNVTGKFFLKSKIKELNLTFLPNLSIGEDFLFLFTFLLAMQDSEYYQLKEANYIYVVDREDSVMTLANLEKLLLNINIAAQNLKNEHPNNNVVSYLALKNNYIRAIPKILKFNKFNILQQIHSINNQINLLYNIDLEWKNHIPTSNSYLQSKFGNNYNKVLLKISKNKQIKNYILSLRLVFMALVRTRRENGK